MFNYYLVMLPKPILVSDEKTKQGELCWSPTQKQIGINGVSWEDTNLKIIAGISELPTIDFSALSDDDCNKISYIDPDKLFRQVIGDGNSILSNDIASKEGMIIGMQIGFYECFKALQELNTKKYTIDDMMNVAGFCAAFDNKQPIEILKEDAENYIKNNVDVKTFNVEIDGNWYMPQINGSITDGVVTHEISLDSKLNTLFVPTLVNNSIKLLYLS